MGGGAAVTLAVRPLARVPEHGTGGGLVPLGGADPKGLAAKVTEEAAEALVAWQALQESWWGDREYEMGQLADELADTVMACLDLAARYGIDMPDAMARCEERNRKRGRYGHGGA